MHATTGCSLTGARRARAAPFHVVCLFINVPVCFRCAQGARAIPGKLSTCAGLNAPGRVHLAGRDLAEKESKSNAKMAQASFRLAPANGRRVAWHGVRVFDGGGARARLA